MQSERTAEEAALSGSARGLGVCDVLRLELVPAQLPQLVEQLEALRAPLEREIRRRPVATTSTDPHCAERLKCAQYELRLVELLCDRLPVEVSEPFALIGPAGMIGTIARGAMRGAIEALAERAHQPGRGREARSRLAEDAAAACAWVRTFIETQAVEDFTFDPGGDPFGPW
jgi:hypothetical protein